MIRIINTNVGLFKKGTMVQILWRSVSDSFFVRTIDGYTTGYISGWLLDKPKITPQTIV